MSRFHKYEVITKITRTGIIPVFYHADKEITKYVIKACYDGGIRAFEFTNRGDFAHETFADLSKFCATECPEMCLGIGSVVDASTAALYIQSGADFIVGPLLNTEIAKICNRRLIPYIPGCGTVSEIGFAQECGCDIIKIFPAGCIGGPAFVKNIMAPMPWSNIMATGCVEPTEASISAWFKAGVKCVGIGSNLFPIDIINTQQWNRITIECNNVIELIKKHSNAK